MHNARSRASLHNAILNVMCVCLLCVSCLTKPKANDEINWWFDVEVIVFKRDGNLQTDENFTKAMFELDTQRSIDLLSIYRSLQWEKARLRHLQPICKQPNFKTVIEDFRLTLTTTPNAESNEFLETTENIDATINNNLTPFCLRQLSELESKKITLGVVHQTKYQLQPIDVLSPVLGYKLEAPTRVLPSTHHHLLADEQLRMNEYADRVFQQRNITPILHIGWRQPVVFGEDNAKIYRVYGGELLSLKPRKKSYEALSKEFSNSMEVAPTVEAIDLFQQLRDALSRDEVIDWTENSQAIDKELKEEVSILPTWELDGNIKVYLRYINGIPYLHLDNELILSEWSIDDEGQTNLAKYPLKQKRRIISKQVHYFDNPKFGLIMRLERYEPPIVEVVEESNVK